MNGWHFAKAHTHTRIIYFLKMIVDGEIEKENRKGLFRSVLDIYQHTLIGGFVKEHIQPNVSYTDTYTIHTKRDDILHEIIKLYAAQHIFRMWK